jgi:hypothetical protein
MTLARAGNYLAFLAIFAAYITAGVAVSESGKVFHRMAVQMFGAKPLPAITELIFSYTASSAPLITGLILGILLTLSLCFVERSERARPYLPLAITIAWTLCMLQLATTLIAVSLPFIEFGFGLST